MLKDRWFIVCAVLIGVVLSVLINGDFRLSPPQVLSRVRYPETMTAGADAVITARLEKADPTDCNIAASLVVQYAGRLSNTRFRSDRVTNDDLVTYTVEVPKNAKIGPARIDIREAYYCEGRTRTAFVKGPDVPGMIVASTAPTLPEAES